MNKFLIFVLIIAGQLAFFPLNANAFSFTPNFIVSDSEFANASDLDLNGIQQLLLSGSLANAKFTDIDGAVRSSAEIIWRAAQRWVINPKVLIVLLQKEQSLIDDDSPSQDQLDWATGYAVCDDCSHDEPSIQRWKGFPKQVNSAAMQFRDGYFKDLEIIGVTTAGFAPGKTSIIDGVAVAPANKATASLYSYTPHLHGNENFARIWTTWFAPMFPNGILLQSKTNGAVYLIEHGLKRLITSKSVLLSRFNPDLIVQADDTSINAYPDGQKIKFQNYSLLRDPSGAIYLIVDDAKRHIVDMEAFRSIGFSMDEVLEVNLGDLDGYVAGDPITSLSQSPVGSLIQDSSTGGVWFVRDGVKHPITTRDILDLNFDARSIVKKSPAELEQYARGDIVKLRDGLLVKSSSSPSVYIVSDGKLRPVVSGSAFESYGLRWENVVSVDPKTILAHETGDIINQAGFVLSGSDTETVSVSTTSKQ
ncbi:MAG: hypothetical protein ACD_76C00106G0002 [uncultured bacterium]|nr:MAG: hypothetical protein ACD_76C00106G0002 [uncultured bacterium]HBD05597.1 hypothetical protein [Candidatus Uhrbacteria bacterium]